MTEGHIEATEVSRGPWRWRYLIDIIVLLAVTFLLDAVLGASSDMGSSTRVVLFLFYFQGPPTG